MPHILVRDLSQETIDRIDAAAADLGLSRNEYLRHKLEEDVDPVRHDRAVTDSDWQRSAQAFPDLANPAVMAEAWREEA